MNVLVCETEVVKNETPQLLKLLINAMPKIPSFTPWRISLGRNALVNLCFPPFLQISGTAMVLDEIINHVQALQRQVEVRLVTCLILLCR